MLKQQHQLLVMLGSCLEGPESGCWMYFVENGSAKIWKSGLSAHRLVLDVGKENCW